MVGQEGAALAVVLRGGRESAHRGLRGASQDNCTTIRVIRGVTQSPHTRAVVWLNGSITMVKDIVRGALKGITLAMGVEARVTNTLNALELGHHVRYAMARWRFSGRQPFCRRTN